MQLLSKEEESKPKRPDKDAHRRDGSGEDSRLKNDPGELHKPIIAVANSNGKVRRVSGSYYKLCTEAFSQSLTLPDEGSGYACESRQHGCDTLGGISIVVFGLSHRVFRSVNCSFNVSLSDDASGFIGRIRRKLDLAEHVIGTARMRPNL